MPIKKMFSMVKLVDSHALTQIGIQVITLHSSEKTKTTGQIRTNENKESAMTKAKKFFDKFFE